MQAIYRASDRLTEVPLGMATGTLRALAAEIEEGLKVGERGPVRELCQHLADTVTRELGIARVRVEVLDSRPRKSDCELYGLYEREEREEREGASCRIRLWMRTAHHRRVVAFKTFLRTLLHELCHHLDFELHRLPESLHTEGFFKRESSLFHQLAPAA